MAGLFGNSDPGWLRRWGGGEVSSSRPRQTSSGPSLRGGRNEDGHRGPSEQALIPPWQGSFGDFLKTVGPLALGVLTGGTTLIPQLIGATGTRPPGWAGAIDQALGTGVSSWLGLEGVPAARGLGSAPSLKIPSLGSTGASVGVKAAGGGASLSSAGMVLPSGKVLGKRGGSKSGGGPSFGRQSGDGRGTDLGGGFGRI